MTYQNFLSISNLKLKNKTVLLRIDINSQIINNKPVMSGRFVQHSKTIKLLKKKNAKVIILAHQGRPSSKDFNSLIHHAHLLKVPFINQTITPKVSKAISNLKQGQGILLENIRFIPTEFSPSLNNSISNFFKNKIDIYINDAFSITHRNETSITSLPKLAYYKAIGPTFLNELKNIQKLKTKAKNALFILGGDKIEDIALLLKKNKILPTGILALLKLRSKNYKFSKEQTKILSKYKKDLEKIKSSNIKEPIDLAFNLKNQRVEFHSDQFPIPALALDIGQETINLYISEIKKAKNIFWKGTAGYCEKNDFCHGTKSLLKELESSKAFCIISGGHSETAIEKYKINPKKLGYVSLSGGALVHFIAGKKLPGLEVLKVR